MLSLISAVFEFVASNTLMRQVFEINESTGVQEYKPELEMSLSITDQVLPRLKLISILILLVVLLVHLIIVATLALSASPPLGDETVIVVPSPGVTGLLSIIVASLLHDNEKRTENRTR